MLFLINKYTVQTSWMSVSLFQLLLGIEKNMFVRVCDRDSNQQTHASISTKFCNSHGAFWKMIRVVLKSVIDPNKRGLN